MYNRICDDCWEAFSTENINVRLCWDCQRLRLIRAHPEEALKDESLSRFAFDNGLIVSQVAGKVEIKDVLEYHDEDERWREDMNKIKVRHKQKRGRRPTFEKAWDLAAKASHRRAAAKYLVPAKPNALEREESQNGEVRIIKPARTSPQEPPRKDEAGGADDHRGLVHHKGIGLPRAA